MSESKVRVGGSAKRMPRLIAPKLPAASTSIDVRVRRTAVVGVDRFLCRFMSGVCMETVSADDVPAKGERPIGAALQKFMDEVVLALAVEDVVVVPRFYREDGQSFVAFMVGEGLAIRFMVARRTWEET